MRDTPRPIGIWRPAEVEGEPAFVRPEPGPFGDHWADRRLIRKRCRRERRLCLLGESAAAGYLLAPHLTPARALEDRLGRRWEVVDLARTNERLDSLAATAEAALQLRPDLLVVWTGNNCNLLETPSWSPYIPSGPARRRFAEALARGGVLGPAQGAARELREKIAETFARLAALDLPVVVVIPEVNLADWESPQPVPWLPGDGVRRWYELLAAARRALATSDLAAARRAAAELLDLDGATCPTGYRLLAMIFAAAGRIEESRTAARAEVDTCRYAHMATLAAPQATATVQEQLREAARRHGFERVDLPERIGRRERLPGRRWFYDYCHLTPEGIDLVAGWVARVVDPEGRSEDDRAARREGLRLSDRHRAEAELGAALHGVHRGARGEIVRHWCRQALATCPAATSALLDLVRARAAPVPAVLTPGQIGDPWLSPQQGWRWTGYDAEIVAAAIELLGADEVAPHLGPRRLEPWAAPDRFYPEAMETEGVTPRAALRSPWPWTNYALVAEGPVEIELVVRLPEGSLPDVMTLSYAGQEIAGCGVDDRWRTVRATVPARPGLGRLTLAWPLPSGPGDASLKRAAARLSRGWEADVHPVFGEVFSARIV